MAGTAMLYPPGTDGTAVTDVRLHGSRSSQHPELRNTRGGQTSGLPLAEVADSCARTSQCSTILPWASRRKMSTPLLPSGPYAGTAPVNFECVITKSQSAKTRLMSTCVSGNAVVKLVTN